MYASGRSQRDLLVIILMLGMLGERGSNRIAEAQLAEDTEVKAVYQVFSPQWVQEYSGHQLGCELGRVSYTWRPAGFGSNFNNLLNAWVYAVAVEGWNDLAVLVDSTQLSELKCSRESEGLASHGWSCLFRMMPHLCMFETREMWKEHLHLGGVSAKDEAKADRLAASLNKVRQTNFSPSFKVLDVDHRGARAVMTKFLWRYMTPWLRKDIHVVTHVRETFETSPFIAIHVRRGDKLKEPGGGSKHNVKEYLTEAVRYLQQEPNGTSVGSIKGIWVASDSADVVNEVRAQAGAYFPSVGSEDIVYAAGGVTGGVQTSEMKTLTITQGYGSAVYLLADLEQLAAADVFVGTCSSNIGRLVMVLRDGLGKEKDSAISLDIGWNPKRERHLGLD